MSKTYLRENRLSRSTRAKVAKILKRWAIEDKMKRVGRPPLPNPI